MKTILIIILIYVFLFFDCKLSYKTKKYKYSIEYNGIVFVLLDMYTIYKYNSTDKHIKLFIYDRNGTDVQITT